MRVELVALRCEQHQQARKSKTCVTEECEQQQRHGAHQKQRQQDRQQQDVRLFDVHGGPLREAQHQRCTDYDRLQTDFHTRVCVAALVCALPYAAALRCTPKASASSVYDSFRFSWS